MGKCKIIKICFYCKRVISNVTSECEHCNRPTRVIKVKTIRKRLSPWYKLFNVKYHYAVVDPKFKYIEHQLNCE